MTLLSTQFNLASRTTVNSVNSHTRTISKSVEKLSTGKRVNGAGDDIASLSISTKLSSELRGITKAKQNIADQMGHLEVLDSASYQVNENLQAIRELFVQGLNGTNDTEEIDVLQREINERVRVVRNIAENTEVINGSREFIADSGSGGNAYNNYIQTGTQDQQGFTIDYNTFPGAPYNPDSISFNPGTGPGRPAINFGLPTTGSSLIHLRLPGASIGSEAAESSGNPEVSQDYDPDGLANLDQIISNMARMQSVYSADQKRLEEAYSYLEDREISLNQSLSHFQDTDMAKESAAFTKAQIRQQAAGSMTTQANAQAQFVLNLLP